MTTNLSLSTALCPRSPVKVCPPLPIPSKSYRDTKFNAKRKGSSLVAEQTYGFLPTPLTPSSARSVLTDAIEYIQAAGPFDALLGFSEGGILAATLLAEDAHHPFAHFKCGVFLSSATPLDPDVLHTDGEISRDGEGLQLRALDPAVDGVVIRVPTAHVLEEDLNRLRGLSPMAPLWDREGTKDPQEGLVEICDAKVVETVRHALGHTVPGAKGEVELGQVVRAIERTVERALE
ncbi:uncharacterized protein LDX57_001370 [Aspergillus melleus]|uniref:uncharacterized protein n=1 Tax=Aspergillus melleus TaxID=138277 RepID=UPI001E8E28C2|nr:uncharacterized protein LDX57_001370 [Aspergillus melleus]KAH8423610.1 hypothetical protein LDX57_001370 [Aspergillus melleus]